MITNENQILQKFMTVKLEVSNNH